MDISGLTDAHAVLLAVQLCINGDITPVPALQAHFQRTLTLDVLLRIILTFLPESVAPARYVSIIQALVDGSVPTPLSELDVDISSIKKLPATDARKRVRRLRLLPIRYPELLDNSPSDSLTQFLIHRAHKIDTESGIQPHILELLEPFLSTSDATRALAIYTVLPLLRFNYEYHPDKEETLSLQLVEALDSGTAVNLLLSKAERQANGGDVAQDLRGLVGPWMYGHVKSKRRKLNQGNSQLSNFNGPLSGASTSGWQDVNEWLLSLSLRDFELLVEAIEGWGGPEDIDFDDYAVQKELESTENETQLKLRYGQAALAAVYAIADGNGDIWSDSCRILSRVAFLFEFHIHSSLNKFRVDDPNSLNVDFPPFSDTHRGLLLHNVLLEPSNPFTIPTPQSVALLDTILLSIRILNDLGRSIPPREIAELCLFADDDTQLFEFHGLLEVMIHGTRPPRNWQHARQQLLWLRDWEGSQSSQGKPLNPKGLFWRIHLDRFEREILKAMLTAKQYPLAVSLYANEVTTSPLPREQVEAALTEAIFIAYDNATNGNKTRGGIKKASEMLVAFSPYFPESTSFRQIKSLIAATHALSFYSLTLQHGVPFQPVSIRVHRDPLSLIGKVLEQNTKAYTQLDNLLVIARHLVASGLPCVNNAKEYGIRPNDQSTFSLEQITQLAERRIISLSVSSALEANDFDTAYSYVLTYLTPPSLISTTSPTNLNQNDQISWRAAYTAGKHPSTLPDHVSRSLQSQITHLSRRMELLSLSLILSPSPEHLPEVLAAWRRCDEEMSTLQAQESAEAEEWDTHGDQSRMSHSGTTTAVPGGFGPSDRELDALETEEKRARRAQTSSRTRRKAAHEEAPIGLFDVARGAARAISKNAFPLRAGSTSASTNPSAATTSASTNPSAATTSAAASASVSEISVNAGATDKSRSGSVGGRSRSSIDTMTGEVRERGSMDRVRKRDVVSNMVTGGLVSGIGWMLGAQPVVNHDHDQNQSQNGNEVEDEDENEGWDQSWEAEETQTGGRESW